MNDLSEDVLLSSIPRLTRELSGADAILLALPGKSSSPHHLTWKTGGACGSLREDIQEYALSPWLEGIDMPLSTSRWIPDMLEAEAPVTPKERESAIEMGYRAIGFIPLQGKKESVGLLVLFFTHARDFEINWKTELGRWATFCALALEQTHRPFITTPAVQPAIMVPPPEKSELPESEEEGEINLTQMGMIASSISHEVTNSLDGIKNYLYLINSEMPTDHPHKEYMEIIEGEIIRAGKIIRQLSDLNKPGKYAKSDLNLNELIESIIPLLDYLVKGKNYEFKLKLAPDIPLIKGVPEQLKSVLINLMKNAIQAMPKGGTITVKTGKSEEHPGKIQIIVADNGPGIAKKDLEKLFQPFFTTKENGTGLGLTICRQIIKSHGGYITVESTLRKGTEFTITLPTGEDREE